LRRAASGYPRQYWLLVGGMLVSAVGGSMWWPFLTIYLRERLAVPLTAVALLFTLHSAFGLLATAVAGPVVDRFGRKGAMVVSLVLSSGMLMAMSLAGTLQGWSILMVVGGLIGPLFGVGADAMVADMIEPERRAEAYAVIRMARNLGVAIGPAIGGFVTAVSFTLALQIAAGTEAIFALLVLFFMRETVPARPEAADKEGSTAGYGPILRDRPFVAFCAIFTLASMAYSLMMVLLPVYAKEGFGVPESQYGFIMSTNAAMVVFLQYGVTRVTERYNHLPVLAVGSLFYALGVGSVALGASFPAFLLSMIILTIGEMILIPTSTALTANLAPADMRGRYMSVYGLTWTIGFGVGPVIGGYLSDNLAPVAIWYGGILMGLAAAAGFVLLARLARSQPEPVSGSP
jgi:MFS family permease